MANEPTPKVETDDERFVRHTKEVQALTNAHMERITATRTNAEALARKRGIAEDMLRFSNEVLDAVKSEHVKFNAEATALTAKHRAEAPPPVKWKDDEVAAEPTVESGVAEEAEDDAR